ncbi:MAG: pyruvate kinase [Candidatus Omnitrophota bacterium]|nr:MAG: pyruvate kinase [Candidatus Omnitrophota bacterium]
MMRTKIIATLGPASSSGAVLRKMFLKGLDMVRLNYSHGTHLEHLQRIHLIRTLNKKLKRAVKIMQDLEGYRIRVGKLKRPFALKKYSYVYLTQEKIAGEGKIIPFDYRGPLRQIKEGTLVYIDDGRLLLEVASKEKRRLKTQVVVGGILRENKGINIPDANLEFPALTEKDKRDVRAAVLYKLDCVAQSFVRSAKDLQLLKGLVKHARPDCKFFAKIENKRALLNIDEIIKEADGIIIARGDLGICVPIYKVPVIQKEIVKRCRLKNRPVVVATQMLDSMTEEPLPTRAETSDVANAILDGATHLLLSGETAVGRHPDRVVEMMDKIIQHTESYQRKLKGLLE